MAIGRLYRDGNMWCAVLGGFRNLAIDTAGCGPTQEQAVDELAQAKHRDLDADDFEVGGYCLRCKEWVPEDMIMDGCRDPECPCQ